MSYLSSVADGVRSNGYLSNFIKTFKVSLDFLLGFFYLKKNFNVSERIFVRKEEVQGPRASSQRS